MPWDFLISSISVRRPVGWSADADDIQLHYAKLAKKRTTIDADSIIPNSTQPQQLGNHLATITQQASRQSNNTNDNGRGNSNRQSQLPGQTLQTPSSALSDQSLQMQMQLQQQISSHQAQQEADSQPVGTAITGLGESRGSDPHIAHSVVVDTRGLSRRGRLIDGTV